MLFALGVGDVFCTTRRGRVLSLYLILDLDESCTTVYMRSIRNEEVAGGGKSLVYKCPSGFDWYKGTNYLGNIGKVT